MDRWMGVRIEGFGLCGGVVGVEVEVEVIWVRVVVWVVRMCARRVDWESKSSSRVRAMC